MIDPPLDPALNMAVDWWLLRTVEQPTLRFYRWNQPVISLGYRQQQSLPENLRNLEEQFDFVVRPTGGGYLYHAEDLSYSIVLPETHDLTDESILASYERLRDRFSEALRSLGLIDTQQTGSGSNASENCLSQPGCHEPVVEDTKWMAASQLRHRRRFLQHGSVFWKDAAWPDSLAEHEPFHLKQPDNDATLEDLKEALIDQLTEELFPDTTRKNNLRDDVDWDRLRKRAATFNVNRLEELPAFNRFGAN